MKIAMIKTKENALALTLGTYFQYAENMLSMIKYAGISMRRARSPLSVQVRTLHVSRARNT